MAWGDHLERADAAAKDILGGDVLYTPGVGDAVTVTGIFEPQHVAPGGPSEVDQPRSWGPAVFLTLDELPSDPETDTPTITIDGVAYTVRDTYKPGNGEVVCLLNRGS